MTDTVTVIMPPDVVYLHTNTHPSPPPLLHSHCNCVSSNMYHRPPSHHILVQKRTLEIGDNMIAAVQCYHDVVYEKR